MFTLCFATTLNEHARYRKCMDVDKKISGEYTDFTNNYNSLFGQLAR